MQGPAFCLTDAIKSVRAHVQEKLLIIDCQNEDIYSNIPESVVFGGSIYQLSKWDKSKREVVFTTRKVPANAVVPN